MLRFAQHEPTGGCPHKGRLRATMQLISRRQPDIQRKVHAGNNSFHPGKRSGTLGSRVVNRLNDDPDALALAQIEITRRLEHSVGVDSLDQLPHRNCCRSLGSTEPVGRPSFQVHDRDDANNLRTQRVENRIRETGN